MSDDTRKTPADAHAAPPSSDAPALTDAEANRQIGAGQTPQAEAEDTARRHTPASGTDAPSLPEHVQGSDSNADPSGRRDGGEADASEARVFRVGARDVGDPTAPAADGSAETMYDRLAQKDRGSDDPSGKL